MKKIAIVIAILISIPHAALASGETIGSLSHIHQVKVQGKKILLGTHEGLYQYIGADKVLRMSPEVFDVMGLSVDGRRIYASGHPGPGSKFPEPVGLVLSTNGGKDWKMVSLQGTVDFHLLESSGSELYGADSQSGDLLYSSDLGKRWASRGKNTFSDIALNPAGKGELSNINLLKAGYHIGIYTIGQSLRNANLQIRSEVPNPQLYTGPWNNSTITSDFMRVPLEIGSTTYQQ